MNPPTEDRERQEAWSQAKLAVRAYARSPSEQNAERVTRAWKRVRWISARATDWQMQKLKSTSKRAPRKR